MGLVGTGLVVWGLVDGLQVVLSGDILKEEWLLGWDLLAREFGSKLIFLDRTSKFIVLTGPSGSRLFCWFV